MWTCPKCHSKIDPSFDVCWNCGTSADGVEDPNFVKADDAAPIEGDPVVIPGLDVVEDVEIVSELPEPIREDLVEAYSAFDLVEAKFLADQLNEAGIQTVCDTHDFQHSLGLVNASPRLWVHEDDLPRARAWLEAYEKNKATHTEEL
jgi:Putative prokaryotic signal transducing protein